MDAVLEGECFLSIQPVGKVAAVQTRSLDDSDTKTSTSLEESCHNDSNLNYAKAKRISSLVIAASLYRPPPNHILR